MAEAAPHHLELIYQLLVQGTHFWVYQLLVHRQADSQNVNLLLHEIFELCDLLCVFRVAGDVVFVKESLLVSGDASVNGGVDDSVQGHAEQVDVAVQLLVLVLADQSPQLLVLILHHSDGVF